MKKAIKKQFNLKKALKRYKDAATENLTENEEALVDAAFKAGAATLFKLAVRDLAKLSDRNQDKALAYMDAQVEAIAAEGMEDATDQLFERLGKLFGGGSPFGSLLEKLKSSDGWLETDAFQSKVDAFDLRDEDVEEKHSKSMDELRARAEEAKASGLEFTVGINGKEFDDVEKAIAYATLKFSDDLRQKRERLSELIIKAKNKLAGRTFESQAKADAWASNNLTEAEARVAQDLLKQRVRPEAKKEAEALADDVQPEVNVNDLEVNEEEVEENKGFEYKGAEYVNAEISRDKY